MTVALKDQPAPDVASRSIPLPAAAHSDCGSGMAPSSTIEAWPHAHEPGYDAGARASVEPQAAHLPQSVVIAETKASWDKAFEVSEAPAAQWPAPAAAWSGGFPVTTLPGPAALSSGTGWTTSSSAAAVPSMGQAGLASAPLFSNQHSLATAFEQPQAPSVRSVAAHKAAWEPFDQPGPNRLQ